MINPLDPTRYPASYRTSVWRGGLRILGFMTLAVIGLLARSQIVERGGPRWFLVFIVLFLLFLLLIIANVTFARITLYPDRIERATWFGGKSMLRADVVKLERRRSFIFFRTYYLVSKRGLFEGILLPTGIEADAVWEAWMTVAQDNDAVQAKDAPNADQRLEPFFSEPDLSNVKRSRPDAY
jgi:uncharacterized membrane protein YhdT